MSISDIYQVPTYLYIANFTFNLNLINFFLTVNKKNTNLNILKCIQNIIQVKIP